MLCRNEKRVYCNGFIGYGIRGSIGKTTTFRMRRGNGKYYSVLGELYQDKFLYTVPSSINNPEGEPYRAMLRAAVAHWKYCLTTDEQKEWNRLAGRIQHLSGYNLFLSRALKGEIEMYVDRGDPAVYDYAKEDLTIDGAWHDLDLSAIIPKCAKAVRLAGHLEGTGSDWAIMFRKNGNVNEVNHDGMETIRASVERHRDAVVALDTNRTIEYKVDDQAWTTLDLVVRAWLT